MRTVLIEILGIVLQHPRQMTFAENEQVIQTLAAYTSEEPFTDSVRARGSNRRFEDGDGRSGRHPIKGSSKLGVMITNEIFGGGAQRSRLAELLGDPSLVG